MINRLVITDMLTLVAVLHQKHTRRSILWWHGPSGPAWCCAAGMRDENFINTQGEPIPTYKVITAIKAHIHFNYERSVTKLPPQFDNTRASKLCWIHTSSLAAHNRQCWHAATHDRVRHDNV